MIVGDLVQLIESLLLEKYSSIDFVLLETQF